MRPRAAAVPPEHGFFLLISTAVSSLPHTVPVHLVAHSSSKSIAVLGAGITGLTAAYRLSRRGHRVRLFEAGAQVGGAIQTERTDEWLIERGPNTVLTGEPALTALIAELGLSAEQVPANPTARNRYIVRGGVAVAAPLSPPGFIRSPLFSVTAKLRLLREMLRRPPHRDADVSLAEFGRAHFGQEIVDYAINPFVTGIYAGDPRMLSVQHAFPKLWRMEEEYGSLLRGQIALAKARQHLPKPGIISFRRGLQVLPDAVAQQLPEGTLALGATIQALLPGSPWSVVWSRNGQTHTETFDAVVAALPAPALTHLPFGLVGERPLASLEAIVHPPVTSLFLGYRREDVSHPLDGFGMLIPEVEKRSILGVLFSSTLFTGRAPTDHVALTVLLGGTRQPELAGLSPDDLVRTAERDLRPLLGVRGSPVFQRQTFWPRAIPQYNLGYEQHLETMAAVERAHPGFFMGGQARDGIALPACVAAGERLADRVAP